MYEKFGFRRAKTALELFQADSEPHERARLSKDPEHKYRLYSD